MLTASQCRAARALIDWSREDLATASQISARTIMDFESGARNPLTGTRLMLQNALEAAGIEFIDRDDDKGSGVRLSAPEPEN
jgi:transcriptional regulator with XRE-family HTH domain